jgi:hypothetical protein
MITARRAALPVALALACIAIYWHALRSWFFLDDYVWLILPRTIHSARDLWEALFTPRAQGTVRVLSERLPFLVLPSVFGINVWPFRILTFATEFANLALVAAIGRRLTGSALAGVAAAVFWLLCEPLATPMAWAAAYNELLWAFTLLLSFYFLLRFAESGNARFLAAQWATYLLGFGALELNAVYPAIALLYAVLSARKLIRSVLWLFIPALVFAALHYAMAPRFTDPVYRMYFDRDLPGTFFQLLTWALGPIRIAERGLPRWGRFGIRATAAIGLGLLIFTVRRLWARDRLPLFLIGWFVIIIAPLVPLKNHVTEYYPAIPAIGLAWLGGYAFASALKIRSYSWAPRIAALVLAGLYLGGNYAEIRAETIWRRVHSRRLQHVLIRAEQIHRTKPWTTVLLDGVDVELFSAGFSDNPFRLFGMPQVYILPANMEELENSPAALRYLEWYWISESDAHRLLESGQGLALSLGNDRVYDTTDRYRIVFKGRPVGELARVDVSNPSHAANLSGDWYRIESGFRWMGRSANVRLAGPARKGEHLSISGFVPKTVLARGPIHLSVSVDGSPLGALAIRYPDQIEAAFPLPDSCVGRPSITVGLSVDHTATVPNDARKFGMVFGHFEVK